MNLFYTTQINGDYANLPEDEARHCVQVLRMRKGETIRFVDGLGTFFEGTIEERGKKKCLVKITRRVEEFEKRNHRLHIAIAPTKSTDRFEWFLEKATEIGIDEITPILCQNSERRKIRPDRLNKVLVAAMKQSFKARLPILNEMTRFSDFFDKYPNKDELSRFITHCREREKEHLKNTQIAGQSVVVLIGPEGDFTLEEIEKANEHGFGSVTLGKNRLRTETAGVVACHIVNLINDK